MKKVSKGIGATYEVYSQPGCGFCAY